MREACFGGVKLAPCIPLVTIVIECVSVLKLLPSIILPFSYALAIMVAVAFQSVEPSRGARAEARSGPTIFFGLKL